MRAADARRHGAFPQSCDVDGERPCIVLDAPVQLDLDAFQLERRKLVAALGERRALAPSQRLQHAGRALELMVAHEQVGVGHRAQRGVGIDGLREERSLQHDHVDGLGAQGVEQRRQVRIEAQVAQPVLQVVALERVHDLRPHGFAMRQLAIRQRADAVPRRLADEGGPARLVEPLRRVADAAGEHVEQRLQRRGRLRVSDSHWPVPRRDRHSGPRAGPARRACRSRPPGRRAARRSDRPS